MKFKSFFIFLLLISNIYSQNQTSNWFFGDKSGINFNKGEVNILEDSEMSTPNGSSSISDDNGNLLFYSNGRTIWNRNHEILKNGDDLAGDITHTQTSIFIPNPKNKNIYYLIYSRTTGSSNPLVTSGTFFSQIELTNDNPLGEVTIKNTRLDNSSPSEKITATHHKDGESFWLVLLTAEGEKNESPKNTLKTYHIDENGINKIPIVNDLGFEIISMGSMKLSPDGTKLAIAANTSDKYLRYIYYFTFNNENGNIIFEKNLVPEPPIGLSWNPNGITFSPNSKFLFYSFITNGYSGIAQYKLEDLGIIENPISVINIGSSLTFGNLQLTNNGEIYIAYSYANDDSEYLGVIEEPNKQGELSSYKHDYIKLTPGKSTLGLPNFIQSYFASKIVTENKCYVDEFSFTAESYATIDNITWDFGDGNTTTGLNVNHTYTTPGRYTVEAILEVGSAKIPVYKIVNAYKLPSLIQNQKLIQCDTNIDGIALFNLNNINDLVSNNSANEEFIFYETLKDAEDGTNEIENPENYINIIPHQEVFVRVINENDCYNITSFFIEAYYVNIGNISEMFVCEDSDGIVGDEKGYFNFKVKRNTIRQELNIPTTTTLRFYPSFIDAQAITNEIQEPFNSPSTTIWLRADTDLGCGGIQSFNIVVNSTPIINLEDSYTICIDPTVQQKIIEADSSNDNYEWKNSNDSVISTNRTFELNTIGTYSLTVYKTENNIKCSNTHTFEVVNPEAPIFNTVDVIANGGTNAIYVNVNGNSTYEFSLNGSDFQGNNTSFTFENILSGIQTISVRDIKQCEPVINTEVSIIGYPNFFTPNNDGNNDTWFLSGVDLNHFSFISVQIFNRYGKLLYIINNENYSKGWNGLINGKELPSNTYWFVAKLIDIDGNLLEKKGNISLIR